MDTKKNKSGPKTLVIGLDGATFDLIMPWIQEGELPCLKKLIDEGIHGNLESVIPSLSAPAWVSFMTGKNPGKHGVISFLNNFNKPFEDNKGGLVNSLSFDDLTIWDILSQAGKKVGAINVPITYPPQKVNGFLISSFLTPPSATQFTYPDSLKDEIPGYKICIEYNKLYFFSDKTVNVSEYKEKIFDEQCEVSEIRTSTAIKLFKKWDVDFSIMVYKGTDDLQHFFWDRKEIILKYYKMLDGMIKRVLDSIDKDANVIILSDHGFGAESTKILYINTWLRSEGLLKMKKGISNPFYHFLYTVGKQGKKLIGNLGYDLAKKAAKNISKKIEGQIDWSESVALGENGGPKGIYILNANENNKQREREEIKEQIIKKLDALTDPETGEKVIHKVFKREEIYSGPNLNKIPEIVFITNPKYSIRTNFSEKIITKNQYQTLPGGHGVHPNGILIAKGPQFKKGEEIKGARLIDIAPTILHLTGTPVPKDMDGRVLKKIFAEETDSAKRPVEYQNPEKRAGGKLKISKEDEEQLKNRLKALGYLT